MSAVATVAAREMSIEREVRSFFESYHAAFAAFDSSRIADHFTYPLHVAGDALGDVTLASIGARDEWIGVLERLVRMYRSNDFRSAQILDLTILPISPRLLTAAVRWRLLASAGGTLYEFASTYTLISAGDGSPYRICAIAHDEIRRSRETASRTTPRSENTPDA